MIDDLVEKYGKIDVIEKYLGRVQKDIAEHIDIFKPSQKQKVSQQPVNTQMQYKIAKEKTFKKYYSYKILKDCYMLGLIGVVALITILTLSLLITRVATIALTMAGLSEDTACFQARSAFTGTGFTTKESEEEVINHPVRRRQGAAGDVKHDQAKAEQKKANGGTG